MTITEQARLSTRYTGDYRKDVGIMMHDALARMPFDVEPRHFSDFGTVIADKYFLEKYKNNADAQSFRGSFGNPCREMLWYAQDVLFELNKKYGLAEIQREYPTKNGRIDLIARTFNDEGTLILDWKTGDIGTIEYDPNNYMWKQLLLYANEVGMSKGKYSLYCFPNDKYKLCIVDLKKERYAEHDVEHCEICEAEPQNALQNAW